jgi:hypothetical protein
LKPIDFEPLEIAINILRQSENSDFKGYDPYDGLNSPLLDTLPILRNKYSMILLTQFFKNFPLNLRLFLGIKKERNAKGIALFASGILNLYNSKKDPKYLRLANTLLDWLKKNRSPFTDYFAWGYNFPWQSRNSFKPKYFPNVVTTSFVAHSFLDYYERTKNKEFLGIATSAASFIIEELNIYKDKRGICFSYSPADNERVYNATLLAAWLLLRVRKFNHIEKLYKYGIESLRFVIESQNRDGSWFYGDNTNQKWIDNFHTGYNLWVLIEIRKLIKFKGLIECTEKGLNYYIKNLFDENFLPKYYNNKKYPLDIHSFAVSIIVLLKYENVKEANQILKEAFGLLYSGKGYFFYRRYPFLVNKINYVRWANAWMFYALTELGKYENMD